MKISEAINNILMQLNKKAESMNDQLILSTPDSVEVYADHDRFIQIMVNIIQNAIQFTENGEIKIAIKETDSDVFRLYTLMLVNFTNIFFV
ncbi:sensor histidine kinase [Enterococcus faecium]